MPTSSFNIDWSQNTICLYDSRVQRNIGDFLFVCVTTTTTSTTTTTTTTTRSKSLGFVWFSRNIRGHFKSQVTTTSLSSMTSLSWVRVCALMMAELRFGLKQSNQIIIAPKVTNYVSKVQKSKCIIHFLGYCVCCIMSWYFWPNSKLKFLPKLTSTNHIIALQWQLCLTASNESFVTDWS